MSRRRERERRRLARMAEERALAERVARRRKRTWIAAIGMVVAEAFLARFPLNYPSIFDPDAEQARSVGGGQGWPTTIVDDRRGRQTFVRQGGYVSLGALDADIRRYALGS